ncbi:50S ribosomal protein L1 [Candidatus Bathyarchaeota archaeon]|nr:50S ribosomal protein L1 [Candidatus Bathyarchaeota archaeon]
MSLDKKAIVKAVREAKEKSEERKFIQSIELIVNLKDVDAKSAQGRIREQIELPHALPEKQNKICVIATGELALRAKRSKADLVMGREELEGIAGKRKDLRRLANEYDVFLSEAPLMPLVGKALGPVLGPRGKMPVAVPPNADIGELIKKHLKIVSVRTRNQPVLQCSVGTERMNEEDVAENIQTVLRAIQRKLKRGMKNIGTVYTKTSMGPPAKIL